MNAIQIEEFAQKCKTFEENRENSQKQTGDYSTSEAEMKYTIGLSRAIVCLNQIRRYGECGRDKIDLLKQSMDEIEKLEGAQ